MWNDICKTKSIGLNKLGLDGIAHLLREAISDLPLDRKITHFKITPFHSGKILNPNNGPVIFYLEFRMIRGKCPSYQWPQITDMNLNYKQLSTQSSPLQGKSRPKFRVKTLRIFNFSERTNFRSRQCEKTMIKLITFVQWTLLLFPIATRYIIRTRM